MIFNTKTATSLLAAAGLAIGAPTATIPDAVSNVARAPAHTHTITAGFNGGLKYFPEIINALPGDVIEWHYLPKNHSVFQSSFDQPCKPLAGGFNSGFLPSMGGENPTVFQVVVQDTQPIWYYCAQTVGSHCQMGMAGVVNQPVNSPNTLDAYKKVANLTGVSIAAPFPAGGVFAPNPLVH